jgi:hypothetical protein
MLRITGERQRLGFSQNSGEREDHEVGQLPQGPKFKTQQGSQAVSNRSV